MMRQLITRSTLVQEAQAVYAQAEARGDVLDLTDVELACVEAIRSRIEAMDQQAVRQAAPRRLRRSPRRLRRSRTSHKA